VNFPTATDGEIAAINLASARRRAWTRFTRGPRLPGLAEAVVDCERLTAQFFGDLDELDRLELLAAQFSSVDYSHRAALVQAEVASAVHRFSDARGHLERAARLGAARDTLERHTLALDQACGVNLEAVVDARRRLAEASGQLEDWIPLGAVLADLELFNEADAVYQQAFFSYQGTSPFPLAWVCFQLGMLWGELVPAPNPTRAALWYRRAIGYLPGYVKARVHLAEVCLGQDQVGDAEEQLLPILASNDPEVRWRLAEVLMAQDRIEAAEAELDAARYGFETLLARHPLAFADHAAEFYAGSGDDLRRARLLACANASNRPTHRALAQAKAIAACA
jgi:tetratricopeptide (TPR) repeat protein